MLALASTSYGQGGTSSTLSGVVTDAGGGVVPGANIVIKHNGTGVTQSGVTNSQGVFSFPGLNVGAYTVTVSLDGFKTIILNDVVLTSGAPASVRPVLEVGGLTEQVIVSSSAEIVQTQSSTVSTTLTTNQIIKLPLTSRSAMDFVNFLPGVSTPGGNRQATINGLPRGTINITLDGVNIQDNTLRTTDGFFAIVSPRLDAVEEVTVTTAAQGADGSGQGAAQVKFVTRSGTNKFAGSGYYYYRNDGLNANTWFNNRNGVAKANLLQNQYGVRVGGPIVIPKLFDGHGRAFFFVNYEEFHQPSDVTRNRTILNTVAQQGLFSYQVGSTVQTVNLLQLAANNGQLATVDPLIGKLLTDIRNSTTKTGSLADIDVNLQRFTYNVPVTSERRFPTFRIDFNLTQKHRFSTAFNYQKFTDYPDTLNSRDANFPGFPVAAGQSSIRKGWSNALRSTLSSSMVNEARVGYSGSPVVFFGDLT
ncbi:MAG: TonB-dependent receptor, partial [Acidobacteriota bacterium]